MLKPCQFTRYFRWSKSNADRRGRASIFTRYSLLSLQRKEPVKSRHGHAHCCQLKTESPDKCRFQSSFDPRRIPFKKGDEREDSCHPPRYSVKPVVWFSDYTNLRIKKSSEIKQVQELVKGFPRSGQVWLFRT